MKIKILIAFNILILFQILLQINSASISYFPEDFSTLERAGYNTGEVLVTSYYFFDTNNPAAQPVKYDYKNGILIHSFNSVSIL